MIPMAVYGLTIPPGEIPVPANDAGIPAAFRITMAAIDPSAEPEEDGKPARATLKIIREALGSGEDSDDEDDEDDEDFDVSKYDRMFLGEGEDEDEDEEDSEDEEVNGGPSDPAKSKKARKAAAEKEIQRLLEEEDMDVDDAPNGVNGVKKSAKALGKMPASDDSEDDEDDEEEMDDEDFIEELVVCTLDPEKHYQHSLDITIGERERIYFAVSGTHSVYLTGNYVEPAGNPDSSLYDPDSDDDEDYDLEPDSDELDEDDEEDELDELENPRITEVDDEDDEAPALIKAAEKKQEKKKGKNKRPAEDEEVADADTIDSLIAKEAAKATNGDAKLSKKQAKKLKKNDGTAAAAEEPSSAKSDKKVSFAKELEQGPTPTKDAKVDKPKAGLGVKVVQGVTIDDKKLGKGPAAKAGDRVGMRYIGKLQKDNSVFDSNKKGKPFTFKLGSGEVIKGWDIGIQGMSAGGERRITIPPHHAYGSKGVSGIPGNSTLVFDVKLLEIHKK